MLGSSVVVKACFFGVCGLWDLTTTKSRVECKVEQLGHIVVLWEIFHQSGIFLRVLLASSREARESLSILQFFVPVLTVRRQIPHLNL